MIISYYSCPCSACPLSAPCVSILIHLPSPISFQVSEPNDPVWWIDRLPKAAFEEGFGLQTPIVNGQLKAVRYYCYFPQAFTRLKKLLTSTGHYCDAANRKKVSTLFTYPLQVSSPNLLFLQQHCKHSHSHDPKTLSAAKIKQLNDPNAASTLDEVYAIVGEDFYVVIPCRSRRCPGVTSEGTRLTLVAQAPEGYEFTIRTPGTPPRWEHFAEELESCFQRLVDLLAAPPPPDRVFTTVA